LIFSFIPIYASYGKKQELRWFNEPTTTSIGGAATFACTAKKLKIRGAFVEVFH